MKIIFKTLNGDKIWETHQHEEIPAAIQHLFENMGTPPLSKINPDPNHEGMWHVGPFTLYVETQS